jgi:hypothetical protein
VAGRTAADQKHRLAVGEIWHMPAERAGRHGRRNS